MIALCGYMSTEEYETNSGASMLFPSLMKDEVNHPSVAPANLKQHQILTGS